MCEAVGVRKQGDLAKYLKIEQNSVSSWKKNGSIPFWHIEKIAKEKHKTISWFYSDENEPSETMMIKELEPEWSKPLTREEWRLIKAFRTLEYKTQQRKLEDLEELADALKKSEECQEELQYTKKTAVECGIDRLNGKV